MRKCALFGISPLLFGLFVVFTAEPGWSKPASNGPKSPMREGTERIFLRMPLSDDRGPNEGPAQGGPRAPWAKQLTNRDQQRTVCSMDPAAPGMRGHDGPCGINETGAKDFCQICPAQGSGQGGELCSLTEGACK